MTEVHVPNVSDLPQPKQSRFKRLTTRKNLQRGAVLTAIIAAALWLKRKLNGSASVAVDAHVETAESPDSNR